MIALQSTITSTFNFTVVLTITSRLTAVITDDT